MGKEIYEHCNCPECVGARNENTGNKLVRRNLMDRKGYSPYCGNIDCRKTPRTNFDGDQFVCSDCGWKSGFPEIFIKEYKSKWNL